MREVRDPHLSTGRSPRRGAIPRRGPRPFTLTFLAGTALPLALIAALAWTVVARDEERLRAIEREESARFITSQARSFGDRLSTLGQGIRAIGTRVEFTGTTAGHRDYMLDLLAPIKDLRTVVIIDSSGQIVEDVREGRPGVGIDVSDRRYFRAHADADTAGTMIHAPVVSRVDGRWTMTMSVPTRGASGELIAVVLASVDQRFLVNSFEASSTGRYRALLVRDDGVTFQSFPHDPAQTNSLLDLSGPGRHPFLGEVQSLQAAPVFGWPLTVTGGQVAPSAAADGRSRARGVYLVAGLAAALVAAFGFILNGQVRRRMAADRHVREQLSHLQAVDDVVPCVFFRQFSGRSGERFDQIIGGGAPLGTLSLEGWYCERPGGILSDSTIELFFKGIGVKDWAVP
jgi:hypothetical protein